MTGFTFVGDFDRLSKRAGVLSSDDLYVSDGGNGDDVVVGRNREGGACLIVPLRVAESSTLGLNYEFQKLRALTSTWLTFIQDGTSRSLRCAFIECLSLDEVDRTYFFEVCAVMLGSLSKLPGAKEVSEAVERIASIFAAQEQPAIKSLRGLAGELTFILSMPPGGACVAAWRMGSRDTHDFVFGSTRLDVKATASKERRHFVSYDQASSLGGPGFFASVFLSESDTGVSGPRLVHLVGQHGLNEAEVQKLNANVANALGDSMEAWRDYKVDLSLAMASLKVYRAEDIPAVRTRPRGVSDVSFRSDFGLASSVDFPGTTNLFA